MTPMPRPSRPLLFAAPAALAALVAFATAALPGCAQRPTQAPLRSLDRSGRVAILCAGSPTFFDTTRNSGLPVDGCDATTYNDIFDLVRVDDAGQNVNAPHVYALVTQQTRGELAVVDLSVEPSITQSILDADLSTPGLNFLPVGAQPVDVVASGGGAGAFVASAEPGRPGIYALPTSELRGPALQLEPTPTATLRSWPACRLPAAPGRILAVSSELPAGDKVARLCPSPNPVRDDAPYPQINEAAGDATSLNVTYPNDGGRLPCTDETPPGDPCKPQISPAGGRAEKLLVTLPERGEVLVIDAQELFERPPGSFDPCPIERAIALRVDLPDAPAPPAAPAETCPALPASSPASGSCPGQPRRDVAYPTDFAPRPAAMALDAQGGRVFIADEGAPVVHVLSLEDGCGLRELPPLLPSSFEEPSRPVFTSALDVSPRTSDLRTFVYAVDRERGTLMAFDVTSDSPSRSPIVRDRPDLSFIGERDRVALGSAVRDVTFVSAARNVTGPDGIVRNGACDPDTSSVDPSRRGDVFRTASDFSDGASPTRLRGVFALATLTSGQVRVIDVDDLDAACRGYKTEPGYHAPRDSFTELPPALTGCESCAVGAYANTLGASGELSCNVVERHEMRSGFYFANNSATGLRAPAQQSSPLLTFNGASLRTDATEEALPNPKLLGPGWPNPYYAPGATVPADGAAGFAPELHSPFLFQIDENGAPVRGVNGALVPVLYEGTQVPVPNPNYVLSPTADIVWAFERGGSAAFGDPAPARAERNFVVPDFREPRSQINQNWALWYEGPLPGFDERFADSRLRATGPGEPPPGFYDPDGAFCNKGVRDRAAARLEGARLLGVPADSADPAVAAALDRFADQHADYAQIANELLPVDDPYWGSPDGTCDYYACEGTYSSATSPSANRDFVILEAYQDRVLVERRDSDGRERSPDPDCCFPTLVRYRVRTNHTWTVLASGVGFQHRTVVDGATGRCVDQGVDPATGALCDPLVALRTGRAYEQFNLDAPPLPADDPDAVLLVPGDVRLPCRDVLGRPVEGRRPADATPAGPCLPPALDDRATFKNGMLNFVVYGGAQPSKRDMIFNWSISGGFVPLQVDLNSRGGLVAPFATAFSPALQRLVVSDGGQNGVFAVNLTTFGFRSYY